MIPKILLPILLTLPLISNGQTLEWSIGSMMATELEWGSSNGDFESVTVDSEGNFYKVGVYDGTADFDPSPDVLILPESSDADESCYIMKIDSLGELVWAKVLGFSFYSRGRAVEIDPSGNVYVWGSYKHQLDADPSDSEYEMENVGWADCVLLKLDSDGEFQWSKNFGGDFYEWGDQMAFDPDGNIVLTGVYQGYYYYPLDCDPSVDVHYLEHISESGEDDVFIIKLDSESNFLWVGSLGRNGYGLDAPKFKDLFMDVDGDIYVTGTFNSLYDMDPTFDEYEIEPTWDIETFILKMSSDGDFEWVTSYSPTSASDYMNIHGMTVSDAGYLYAVGAFHGEVDFDALEDDYLLTAEGLTDAFITKISVDDGAMVWTKVLESPGTDVANDITHNAEETLYLTGWTNSSEFDLDPGTNIESRDYAGDFDIFVDKLDEDGNFIWGELIGGTASDKGKFIGLDGSDNIFMSGIFTGEVDFDFLDSEYILDEEELGNLFFLKLNGNCSVRHYKLDIESCGEYTSDRGIVYTESGVYIDTIFAIRGCDRIITINLTVNPEIEITYVEMETCEEYIAPTGEVFISPGTFLYTLPSVHECDSVISLTLSRPLFREEISAFACLLYTVPSGDEFITESGVYSDTLLSIGGCDSILTIHVTIFPEIEMTYDEVEACSEYTVPSGEVFMSPGTYVYTLPSVHDCDSVINLTLTRPLLYEEISVSSCFSYTVPSGDEFITESGVYSDTILSVDGCDSILTITVEILGIDNTVSQDELLLTANLSGATYQWVDCNDDFEPMDGETDQNLIVSENGSYAVIVSEGECVDTSDCFIYDYLAISENSNPIFKIYPNPTSGQVTIDFSAKNKETIIRVYSITGEIIFAKEFTDSEKITFDFEAAAGFYLLEISNDNNQVNRVKIQHL